jgi:DNA-binding NtrC family response regulator
VVNRGDNPPRSSPPSRGPLSSNTPPVRTASQVGLRKPYGSNPPPRTPPHWQRTTEGGVDSVAIPRLELLIEREAGEPAGRLVVFDSDLCRIGAHPGNDLTIEDPQVSRFHCRLTRTDSGWRIADAGALNGTYVGGVRVRDADLPLPECRIQMGDSVVRVRELGSATDAEVPAWPSFGGLYGSSVVMRRLFALLDRVARSDSNVLIEGESGTGKELVATEIVQRGLRADRPFVIVDCSAISPSLIASELFGHVRGAFTGADRDRVGAFEAADRGTLFLDEIGELPLDLQPMLLRAIEAREIRRIGETHARKVDVRLIAATNRKLEREVNHGRFREDLYFRLSVVTVRVPPLRERLDDVPLLVEVLLESMKALDKASLFTADVVEDMQRYDWPGNVRELKNYVERALVLDRAAPTSSRSNESWLPPAAGTVREPNLDVPFTAAKDEVVADFERRYLTALLRWAGGNISRAARRAGMDRMYLHRLMQRHDMRSASFKGDGNSDPPPSSRIPPSRS